MLGKIRNAFKIGREIRYLRSILKRYSASLVLGKYYLLDGFRAVALDDPATREFARQYFTKPGISQRLSSIAARLNRCGCFVNRNKKSSEEYEAFYTANNYDKIREIKLFSFQRNKMLTICTDSSEQEKQIKQYERFGKAYHMPTVQKSDHYPNAFEISMVKFKTPLEEFFALETIARSTMSFHASTDNLRRECVKNLISFSYDNEEMNSLLKEIAVRIDPTVAALTFPLCMQHGDLSKDNLIYGEAEGETDFWWIDWEHARERVFLYDYFFYIVNSAVYYDTKAYECYMSGKADDMLAAFFAHFGLTFVSAHKKDYFLAFMIIFLKERVCDLGNLAALKMYCEFLDQNSVKW